MHAAGIERDAWLKLGHLTIDEVLRIHDEEEYRYIFGNGMEYVSEHEMHDLRHRYSLTLRAKLILVKAENLTLHTERNRRSELKTRASFTHHGRQYEHIRVTDPEYEGCVQNIGTAYLVMSMPVKPFMGRYYKLIAKILPYFRPIIT